MKCSTFINRQFPLAILILAGATGFAVPTLKLVPQRSDAIYLTGEDVAWWVELHGDSAADFKNVTYSFKEGGGRVVGQGTITCHTNRADIHASLSKPGTILADVTVTSITGETIHAQAGAAIAPHQIQVSAPCPADFDAFWNRKLSELAAVRMNPVLQPKPSGNKNVSYWKIALDNIRGTKIHGQLARPVSGSKFPALLIVQWAGVYPLDKSWATDRANEGWLALNILAHDLPIDRPKSFYDKQNERALKNYTAIGDDNREQSYFLRMFLACYRAVDYLSERSDWDGKTLVVTGTSQGGLQGFVAAGLNHKVTAVLALVPAGCDNTGALVGRKPGWPYWVANGEASADPKSLLATSRYFDGVNFAARITCPVLVGLGLIDTTATPSGIFAALNQMQGPKEVIVMPEADHQGHNNSQAPYFNKEAAWRKALLQGLSVLPATASPP